MRKVVLTLSFSLAAVCAHAAEFLDGDYGDKNGCIYAKTGNTADDADFFLLNSDGITTAAATCDFDGTAEKTATGFSIKTQCDADGEPSSVGTATLTRSDKGYAVTLPDGTKMGPVPKCR